MKEILIDPEKKENIDSNFNLQDEIEKDDNNIMNIEEKGDTFHSLLDRLNKPVLWEEIIRCSKIAGKIDEKGEVNLFDIRKKTEVIIRKSTISLKACLSDKQQPIQIDEILQEKKEINLNNSLEEIFSEEVDFT